MRIRITQNSGKKIVVEVNDQNMTALLGRLKGPDAWIDLNGDNRKYLNRDAILMIEEMVPPEES